jgi:hypothetical protein
MRGRGYSSRRLAAAGFVGSLGLVLALALATPGARSPLREPFVPKATRGEAVTIPLEARESRRRTSVYRLALSVVDSRVLLDHEELHLMFASAPSRHGLLRAELRARVAGCLLEAESGGDLVDGEPVVFRKTGSCSVEGRRPAALDLTLELQGDGTLALLAFQPLAGSAPGPVQVPSVAGREAAFDARGAFVDYTQPAPRIELLNHMWRLAPGTSWLWLSLGAGVVLVLVGSMIFPTRPGGAPEQSRAFTWASGVAAALLAGGLGLLYAILVPPLMGPDEPYHMLGFSELASDRVLAEDTVAWMGETHLWRIRYQPAERFRTIDVGRPYVVEDDQLRPTEVAMRSALLARVWRAAAPLLHGRSAPRVLLTLRLLNALVFAVAVGIATAFASATVDEPFPQWLGFPFLFVPSLPFFAMHVSETALLCSSYVLLATGVAVLFLDGPRASWTGIPLGLGTGLMLAGGRSPWPLAGLVAVVLLGRILLGSRATDARRATLVFWLGLSSGAAVLLLVPDEAYRRMTADWAERYTPFIPNSLREGGEWLVAHPGASIGLAAAAAVVEMALRQPRVWVARLGAAGPRLVRASAMVLAGFVLLSLVGSLLVSYPQLELAPRRALEAPERVAAVLATMATMFRLGDPNFLLSTSFWVGFGWLDTSPEPWFEAILVALVACALVLLLRHIAQRAEARRLLWLVILGAGGAIALVLYTLTTQVSKPLHGRYLIGWYLCLLAVIGSALTLDHRSPAAADVAPSGTGRAAFLLATAGLIHVYCLSFILARYF